MTPFRKTVGRRCPHVAGSSQRDVQTRRRKPAFRRYAEAGISRATVKDGLWPFAQVRVPKHQAFDRPTSRDGAQPP